jgi:hypothetical protein
VCTKLNGAGQFNLLDAVVVSFILELMNLNSFVVILKVLRFIVVHVE